ncbi:MAG: hypothetical protein JXR97_03755 [Planctomycetes bacterium]|nr:hypothetical protein [Planctomycetota bacterium]
MLRRVVGQALLLAVLMLSMSDVHAEEPGTKALEKKFKDLADPGNENPNADLAKADKLELVYGKNATPPSPYSFAPVGSSWAIMYDDVANVGGTNTGNPGLVKLRWPVAVVTEDAATFPMRSTGNLTKESQGGSGGVGNLPKWKLALEESTASIEITDWPECPDSEGVSSNAIYYADSIGAFPVVFKIKGLSSKVVLHKLNAKFSGIGGSFSFDGMKYYVKDCRPSQLKSADEPRISDPKTLSDTYVVMVPNSKFKQFTVDKYETDSGEVVIEVEASEYGESETYTLTSDPLSLYFGDKRLLALDGDQRKRTISLTGNEYELKQQQRAAGILYDVKPNDGKLIKNAPSQNSGWSEWEPYSNTYFYYFPDPDSPQSNFNGAPVKRWRQKRYDWVGGPGDEPTSKNCTIYQVSSVEEIRIAEEWTSPKGQTFTPGDVIESGDIQTSGSSWGGSRNSQNGIALDVYLNCNHAMKFWGGRMSARMETEQKGATFVGYYSNVGGPKFLGGAKSFPVVDWEATPSTAMTNKIDWVTEKAKVTCTVKQGEKVSVNAWGVLSGTFWFAATVAAPEAGVLVMFLNSAASLSSIVASADVVTDVDSTAGASFWQPAWISAPFQNGKWTHDPAFAETGLTLNGEGSVSKAVNLNKRATFRVGERFKFHWKMNCEASLYAPWFVGDSVSSAVNGVWDPAAMSVMTIQ